MNTLQKEKSKNEYGKLSNFYLHRLCANGDRTALMEWKARWAADYPNMGS